MGLPFAKAPRPGPASDRITDTNQHDGEWCAVQSNGAAVTFTELVSRSMSLNAPTTEIPDPGQSHAGMVLGAGQILWGIFTTIKRASGGEVIAYRPPFRPGGV